MQDRRPNGAEASLDRHGGGHYEYLLLAGPYIEKNEDIIFFNMYIYLTHVIYTLDCRRYYLIYINVYPANSLV